MEVIFDGCSGQGGAARGYAQAGHYVVGVDNNPAVRKGYLRSGAAEFICADVLEVMADRSFMGRFTFAHYSPPCFPAGTPVVTERGIVGIEDIRVGDRVLTHQNRWRPVTATMSRQADVWADGWLASTADHPFWARDYIKGRGYQRRVKWSLNEPGWVPARDLHEKFIALPESAEALPIPAVPARRTKRGSPVVMNAAFWWMIGRWAGDGWLRITEPSAEPPSARGRTPSRIPVPCLQCGDPAGRNTRHPNLWNNYCSQACRVKSSGQNRPRTRSLIIICCGNHEADGLASKLADTGLTWTRTQERTTVRFQASHTGLVRWLADNFGRSSASKTIPGWLLGADAETRQAFLDGYISADGCLIKSGYALTTISTGLAFGLRLLATSLGYTTVACQNTPAAKKIIEGRTVNQRPWWRIDLRENNSRYTQSDGQHRWVKRRRPMTFRGREPVYDLTVEDDHSFVAWGFVVHNCQFASALCSCRPGLRDKYPDLITPGRPLLNALSLPYVIENVGAARPWLLDPAVFCMWAFGRETYRHRLIEAGGGFSLLPPPAPPDWPWHPAWNPPSDTHQRAKRIRRNRECGWPHPVPTARAGHWKPGMFVSVGGHERKEPVQAVMEAPWMTDRDAVAESIPWYLSFSIAEQLTAWRALEAAGRKEGDNDHETQEQDPGTAVASGPRHRAAAAAHPRLPAGHHPVRAADRRV